MTDGKRKEYFGQSLKCIRLRRGMTQRELAQAAGLGESALRSYELGARYPKEKHVDAMARELKVRPEAFNRSGIATELAFIHALFNYEDEFRLEPDERGFGFLSSDSRHTARALRDWGLMRAKLRTGEVAEEEYADWKDTYNPMIQLGCDNKEEPDPYTGRYSSECRVQPCAGGGSEH